MDDFTKMRLFILFFIPLAVVLHFRNSTAREENPDERPDSHRYTAYSFYSYNLQLILLVGFFLLWIFFLPSTKQRITIMLSLMDVFLHITLFYLLLALFIPVLRRYFTSRSCAVLWLIPNVLYLSVIRHFGLRRPYLTVYVPETLLERLHWVMRPKKRRTGGLLVGLITAALLLTCGSVALAYERGTAEDLLFRNDPAGYELADKAKWHCPDGLYSPDILQPQAMTDYVVGLTLELVSGEYDIFYDYDPAYTLTLTYYDPGGKTVLSLRDHVLVVDTPDDYEKYFLPEPVDWDYLESLLAPYA